MSRLAFLVFLLFFVVLGYVAYISKIALEENRANQEHLQSLEQLRSLVLQLAGDLEKPMALPADPALIQAARRRLEALELKLSSVGTRDETVQTAFFLSGQARAKLAPLFLGQSSDSEALSAGLAYIIAAENLAFPQKDVLKIQEGAGVPPETGPRQGMPPAAQQNEKKTYRVKKGDTLWGISKKLYQTPWRWDDIRKLNASKLSVYKRMPPGMELILPSH